MGRKAGFIACLLFCLVLLAASDGALKPYHPKNKVCGDPAAACAQRSSVWTVDSLPGVRQKDMFSFDLAFEIHDERHFDFTSDIDRSPECYSYSEPFYAVMLASQPAIHHENAETDPEHFVPGGDCGGYFTEEERLAAQKRFPKNKVFASRERCFGHRTGYTNTDPRHNFLAVFGGRTKAEAEKILATAKKVPGWESANLRRLQVSFYYGLFYD